MNGTKSSLLSNRAGLEALKLPASEEIYIVTKCSNYVKVLLGPVIQTASPQGLVDLIKKLTGLSHSKQ